MASKEHGKYSLGGGDAVEFDEPTDQTEIEDFDEAKQKDPSEAWQFWSEQIQASLTGEKRFREEGKDAEQDYFGEEDKAYTTQEYKKDQNRTNIIHANIEVLKPLVYSETPDPIVRRRYGGDGKRNSDTDRIAALVMQRLAEYLIETSKLDEAMEAARDDWLVPGRGTVRVMYNADFRARPVFDPQTGQPAMSEDGITPVTEEYKARERIKVRHWPWSRVMYGPTNSWDELPWAAFETPMTKKEVANRFDKELDPDNPGQQKISELMDYPIDGLKGKIRESDRDFAGYEPDNDVETSQTKSSSTHDQCIVYEIWNKKDMSVIWWSPHYRDDILDEVDDPMGLEDFFNSPKPLLSVTKNGMLTPRPDTAFYRARADEIDKATSKLSSILNAISVSGLYPGKMNAEIKKLLKGDANRMIPIEEWIGLMEKGGSDGIIQWLPLDAMIKAAQALITMREQAKMQLYEISGISDIVRGQSDPNETLGAQQLKGNYANLRLRDKQSKMHRFARDTIIIMTEMAIEHFDDKTIVDIVNMELPDTDAKLQAMNMAVQQAKAQHAQMSQMAKQAKQPAPPPPNIPFYEQTSWEAVFRTLRDDMKRKFTISIETDGTILQDQEEDKKQRVEFLQAFAAMVESMFPLAQSGVVEMKVIKELLLFAVRGFPKSRTLEGMLASLPDQANQEPKEDTQVTVAKIRSETDLMIAQMEQKGDAIEGDKDRAHETRLKGAELMAKGFVEQMKPQPQPPRQ